jgi:hypothetical protein
VLSSGPKSSGQGSLTGGLRELPCVRVLLEFHELAVGNIPHVRDLCVDGLTGQRLSATRLPEGSYGIK